MSTDFDVVIVGFGPSGAVAAGLFGQAGLRTLVVDRARDVYPKPRAIAIDHEILRLFQNLGVSEQVLPYVAPFPASEHFGVDGQLIRRIHMVPEPYPLGYVPSMVFTQPPVEAALRRHAASFAGVEIALGVSFTGLEQDADGVSLRLQDEGGDTRTVRAMYVVGCDGASSQVRQHLGIALRDLVFDEPWMVIDVRVNEAGLAKLPATAAQFCEPARPSTYIVGLGNHRRWEIMLLPGEDPRAMEQEAAVWGLLARWLTPDDGTLWRATSYRFHALVAEAWRRGRVFIAGDAAHQQPPFLGQGMCQGIRDVANLAWKLEAVLNGHAPDTLLDTYGAERGQHVMTLTSRIKAIGHSICERDPDAARARDARLLAEGGGVAPSFTRQEIVPPLETGLLASPISTASGTLFPQPWVVGSANKRQRMDELGGGGWRLVLDGRATLPAEAPGPRRIVVAQPGQHGPGQHGHGQHGPGQHEAAGAGLTLVEQDAVVAGWFDRHGCTGALVRPDQYVFGTMTGAADAPALIDQWTLSMGRAG